jgi:molybdenum cofactor synthesis domain-containing protein
MTTPQEAPVPARQDDRLLHPSEALEIVLANVPDMPVIETPLTEASWKILARDFVAPEDHPPFPAATMDGYAVVAEDASPWREVIGVQAAGSVLDLEVTPGVAAKIMTGAPIPQGADAVVPVEETEPAEDHVIIHQQNVNRGQNIRPIGVDVSKGEQLLEAGTLLGPAEIGLLAAFGADPVQVRRTPRVSVISTGDELIEPDAPIAPGQIRDSNRFSLIAALQQAGAQVVWSGMGPDDRRALEDTLLARLDQSDIVITSGGVSMGELDLVKAILGDLATVHFRRVFVKPGKPLNFATIGEKIVFGLPGNPVSALVSFQLFIRPALAKMTGQRDRQTPEVPVRILEEVHPVDRIEYQRCVVQVTQEGQLVARPTGPQASSRLMSLVGANALLIVPPADAPYAAGSMLNAIMIGPLAR